MKDAYLIEKLQKNQILSDEELMTLLKNDEYDNSLAEKADFVRRSIYRDEVYIRGLIEFTDYCKNNCFYCGIRRDNSKVKRYRLTGNDILKCCDEGYSLGFRTFVLQGGEDEFYTDSLMCGIISKIKSRYPDCAITLSMGEKSRESYKAFFDAGASRYLLRHEAADGELYKKLHPKSMSLENRKKCLFNLKEIGYQTGAGFMVGSPFQTYENIISDLKYLQELKPDMIGIGPYITHKGTPFRNFENGSVKLTLKLISILRLMHPYALIPSTTALGTIVQNGRERGLKAGANVVMPNLSPESVRGLYELYDNKNCTGGESAQGIEKLKKQVKNIGYRVVVDIGDVKNKG